MPTRGKRRAPGGARRRSCTATAGQQRARGQDVGAAPVPNDHAKAILRAESRGRNWGGLMGASWRDDHQEMLGPDVAKETVQHVVGRHITNPKHVKTLVEGWEADVKEHVATSWQSGAHISEQKRSRQAVRQATGVLEQGWRGAGRRAPAEAMRR
jgi:hypothetical protein